MISILYVIKCISYRKTAKRDGLQVNVDHKMLCFSALTPECKNPKQRAIDRHTQMNTKIPKVTFSPNGPEPSNVFQNSVAYAK